ncbi:unnamed protein product [Arabidopsis thaliana]|uniref:Zinc finger PHD-type domain-containing protein n=1 Tax=Arabidopsis thaliana TaxID=3702 RepID=A0A654FXP4_ARATH|nr:unnamed protein product [Arabidopsis thaliana]
MNPVGEFHEEEIDEKTFFLYNSSTSSGEDIPLQPLFLCPLLRVKTHSQKDPEANCDDQGFVMFDISPHFPSADPQVHYMLDSHNRGLICKLPVLPLFWCNNKEPNGADFCCSACKITNLGTAYYFCATCRKKFHKECVESPLEIKHPSYPFQSLQLYSSPFALVNCVCCDISFQDMIYHSSTYKVSMHPVCAMKPVPSFIDHTKRHPHPLTFSPSKAFLPCNVCGLIKESILTYVCVPCDFVVHQDCIYFPHIIKISRHHHHIIFTSSLPSAKWSCGVCRGEVDNHYGAYSCIKCGDYFVHTRCALRKDVWNGEDLEGIPEEPEMDVEPYEMIADGIILHFSHDHHLKLEIGRVYDENKFCQACILPIYEATYYSCMDTCDFILHEACANAPRKKHHPLHPHPLTLKVVSIGYDHYRRRGNYFECRACRRQSCGFVYDSQGFSLDLWCASVSEPFEYQGHEHPLFLALEPDEEKATICQICQEDGDGNNYIRKLNCMECKYIICFRCATLPYKAKYKHDKHFLTFREGEEGSDQLDWCEVCEKKLVYSRKGGFYACDDCCTTLHVDCLLGGDEYMLKPGHTVMTYRSNIHILPNNTMTRPFCHGHKEDRCPHKVIFKWHDMTFCSYSCSMD